MDAPDNERDPPSHLSLAPAAASAFFWSFLHRGFDQIIQLVISIILARLLSPEDFGLLAMVLVVTGFAQIFVSSGTGAAMIQRMSTSAELLDTIFWLHMATAVVLTAIVAATSGWIADIFGYPTLRPLLLFVSLVFLLEALAIIQRTQLARALDFRRLAIINMCARLSVGVACIGLALGGAGVWSLAVNAVAGPAFVTALLWFWGNWRPRMRLSTYELRSVVQFGLPVLGHEVTAHFARNADTLLVAKFLGASALGLYSRAFTLMLAPLRQVSAVVNWVLFPALSSIQHDTARVASIYIRMCAATSLVTAPLMFGLLAAAESTVLVLFGQKWVPMTPVLKVLALVGYVQSIGALTTNLYLSQNRSRLMFNVGIAISLVTVAAVAIGIRFGILGVAVAYATASLLLFFPQQFFALRLVDQSLVRLLRALLPSAACAAGMATVVALFAEVAPVPRSSGLMLTFQVVVGGMVYAAAVHLIKPLAYMELLTAVQARMLRIAPRR